MMNKEKMVVLPVVLMVALLAGASLAQAGSLEPPAPPAPTMKTLDEIPPTWSQTLTSTRFVLVLGGAGVLDKETGLVWEQNLSTTFRTWGSASFYCYDKNVGNRKGWRLPTVEELASLVDPSQSNPSLPSGHPFSNVQSSVYWSASTFAGNTTSAWYVLFGSGFVLNGDKALNNYAWCVRGGHGHDGQ